MAAQKELVALRDLIIDHFDEEELKEVCFRLSLVYADLPSAGRRNKARDLVTQMNRENRLPDLLTAANNMRPKVDWPAWQSAPSPPPVPMPAAVIVNPFGRTGKIQDPANYLVRQPLTRHVFEELEKGVSLSVVGESQSGKSSLPCRSCATGFGRTSRDSLDVKQK